eukprot:5553892-Prorocentrum_lima.AAC.1
MCIRDSPVAVKLLHGMDGATLPPLSPLADGAAADGAIADGAIVATANKTEHEAGGGSRDAEVAGASRSAATAALSSRAAELMQGAKLLSRLRHPNLLLPL